MTASTPSDTDSSTVTPEPATKTSAQSELDMLRAFSDLPDSPKEKEHDFDGLARALGAERALEHAENRALAGEDVITMVEPHFLLSLPADEQAAVATRFSEQSTAIQTKVPPGWFPHEFKPSNRSFKALTFGSDRLITLALVICVLILFAILVSVQ